MAKQITASRARDILRKPGRCLMVTYQTDGKDFAIHPDGPVGRRTGRDFTDQLHLFAEDNPVGRPVLIPNEDGLFPGFTQTWRVVS